MPATFVGDSVAASISYTPQARTLLSRGLKVRLDLRVCRRLVTVGCPYQGSTPPNALQAVQSLGRSLGEVLIVYVGYNESSAGYGKGIDQIMRAALGQGARGVVWVTLREERDIYRQTNAVIRSAASRWPQLQVADWNAYSNGKPWFSSDGLHGRCRSGGTRTVPPAVRLPRGRGLSRGRSASLSALRIVLFLTRSG